MDDSRETSLTRAFVCGYPIKHSRSPIIHRHWLSRYAIPGSYDAVAVTPGELPDFMDRLRSGASGFSGGNVTIPHKEAVFSLADLTDERARELGAANTLYVSEGRICATNTDGYGFLANLDERTPGWDRDRAIAVILGAGGASRAVIQAVRDRGFAELHVVNRTLERARNLADLFGDRVHAATLGALPERLAGANLFVNTSALGMDEGETIDIDFSPMSAGALVTDIVYVPLDTPFLRKARQQGFRTVDGLGMLLHQAVPGFEHWFGTRPEVTETLRQLIVDDLERHQ